MLSVCRLCNSNKKFYCLPGGTRKTPKHVCALCTAHCMTPLTGFRSFPVGLVVAVFQCFLLYRRMLCSANCFVSMPRAQFCFAGAIFQAVLNMMFFLCVTETQATGVDRRKSAPLAYEFKLVKSCCSAAQFSSMNPGLAVRKQFASTNLRLLEPPVLLSA